MNEGIILTEKRGKTVYYRRAEQDVPELTNVLDSFSEVAPCGVAGSFLLDKKQPHEDLFALKHHYIPGAMDSTPRSFIPCWLPE